jgi:Meiotically up-regulated gene 113
MERIWELSDASVPFDFDVHALISAEDAPGLEGVLHRSFVLSQVNKINWRKEFFRVPIEQIRSVVESLGFQAQWTMTAAAQQFYETQALEKKLGSDADFRARWVEEQSGADFSLAVASKGNEAIGE